MTLHVVLFEPKRELSPEARARIFADVQTAAATIPSVRRCRIGRRLRHGLPGYEQAMRDDYSFVLILEFDDRAGLESYLRHPAHHAVGLHFASASERALAYDYDASEAHEADAAHLTRAE